MAESSKVMTFSPDQLGADMLSSSVVLTADKAPLHSTTTQASSHAACYPCKTSKNNIDQAVVQVGAYTPTMIQPSSCCCL